MISLKEIKSPVSHELDKFNDYFKQSFRSDVYLLNLITNYVLRSKGKQMRPLLVLLVAKLTGNITSSTYDAATLIELMHTATLIHDDVVDDAANRRGLLTLHKIWKNKIAVLIGDYLLSRGLLLAVKNKEYDLLEIVSGAVKEMSEGELLQIEKSKRLDISEEVYFKIIRKKTASLLASCAAAGAKSAGSDAGTVQKLKLFGENLGIAFQIKDDILDYNGNKTGKKVGNDIKEKKITLPLLFSLKQAENHEKRKIIRLLRQKNKTDKTIREIFDFVATYDGITYATRKMNDFTDAAIAQINDFKDSPIHKNLLDFVEFVVKRSK
ncbi:MAG: polyprenyl synthetase family protein [Bacteroidales bacterium]|nr:polyprenyl synthetase family protein [Bacteroidales bacterium]